MTGATQALNLHTNRLLLHPSWSATKLGELVGKGKGYEGPSRPAALQ